MKILIKAGKRAAESAYLPITPFLLCEPVNRVETVFMGPPGFVAKWIPYPLRGEAASGVLNRNDITIGGQELRRTDADHHGLVFSVWRAFQQYRVAPRLGWEVQVGSEAGSIRHGNGNIPPDRPALGHTGRSKIRDKLRRNQHASALLPGIIVRRDPRVRIPSTFLDTNPCSIVAMTPFQYASPMSVTNTRGLRSPATPEDVELFVHVEANLYTAVVADSLDELGYHDQAMNEFVRPLFPACRFAGWARTISCVDIFHVPENTYAKEIEAVDSLLSGEVAVVSTAGSKRNAPWGELLSTAARARGARGAVIDGLVRDVKKIEELGFPVFAAGIKPVDSRGRGVVIDCNVPVDCGGVLVSPGDLVFADYDGVVVIPAEVLPDAIRLATEKVTRENHTREELLRGAYLRDVYEKYGVL